jgi:hypothetical protein
VPEMVCPCFARVPYALGADDKRFDQVSSALETVQWDFSYCVTAACPERYGAIKMSQRWLEPCFAGPRRCGQPGRLARYERTVVGENVVSFEHCEWVRVAGHSAVPEHLIHNVELKQRKR